MAEFATCSQDSVVFWDYKSFSSKRSSQPFGGAGYHIHSAAWSGSNSKLMVAPKWGDCIAWCEQASNTLEWNTIWHKERGHFTCGWLLNNSRYLLSGSSDGLLMIWDLKNKSPTTKIEGHSSPLTAVACGSGDQCVLSGGQDGTLLLHTLSSLLSTQSTVTLSHKDTPTNQGAVTRLRFSVMDRALAASSSDSGCVCLWSVESQRMLHKFPSSGLGPATDLCFAQSNNKLLVSVSQDCKIRFLDIQQRKEVMMVSTPSPFGSVAILRDGYSIAAGGVDGKLYVYELRAMKSPKHVLEAHQGAVTCVAEQNSVKSSRSSMKKGSSKKSAKESSRLSSFTPSSDTLQTTATPDSVGPPFNHSIQPVSAPNSTPLVPPESTPQPPLPLATHLPLSSRALPPQTPFLGATTRGAVQWGQFTTPAQTASDKDSTGIFSPVDSTLSTPHPSSGSEAVSGGPKAAAPDTHQLQTTAATGEKRERYPLVSTFVSSTPAMQQPPLGMSGIFSPLDAATPAALVSAGLTGRSLAPGVGGGWQRNCPLVTPSASTPALSGVGVSQPPPNSVAGQLEGVLPIPTTSQTNYLTAPSSPPKTSSCSQLSCESDSSPPQQPVSHNTRRPADSEVDGPDTAPLGPSSQAGGGEGVQLPIPAEMGNVHLQYIENLIRDSNEELRLATHRDIRALGLDMFRQFLILQQEVSTAVTALHEKVDRLSEENKRLHELLHQYAPNY